MSLLFTRQSAASSSIAGGLLGVRAQPRPGSGWPRPGSGCGPAQGAAGPGSLGRGLEGVIASPSGDSVVH